MSAWGWLAAAALALPARAGVFSRSTQRPAVLWIPAEQFQRWDQAAAALSRCPSLRLTIAVEPAQAAAARAALRAAVSSGQVELAARLEGDPILPLIDQGSRALEPQRVVDRVAAARQAVAGTAAAPAGFVPGAGALSPELFGALRAAGARWAAVGPYAAPEAGWARSGGLWLVPFQPAADPPAVDALSPGQPVVFDDGSGAPSGMPELLAQLASSSQPCQQWATVSEALAAAQTSRDAAQLSAWPSWTPLSAWQGSPGWPLYAKTADALARYQNSGQADLKALETASDALAAAEDNGFYRDNVDLSGLRGRLLAVFRTIGAAPPVGFWGEGAGPGAGEDGGALRSSGGDAWLQFDNPAATASRAPDAASPLDDGSPASSLWKLQSLRVDWGDEGTTLTYRLAKLDPSGQPPAELGRLLLETYIDLNHRPGAGETSTLEPRTAAIASRDAWEYALSLSASGGYLLRANALGSPLVVGKLQVRADPQRGEVSVTIPPALLRGNPARWGYLVLALAVDPATLGKQPPRALLQDAGSIMGLLGPLDEQERALKSTGRPLLDAARLTR